MLLRRARNAPWHRHAAQALASMYGRHLSYTVVPRYNTLSDSDISTFASIVGKANVITDSEDLQPYNIDWMGKYHGASKIALRPASTREVAAILSHCHSRRLPLVPQGGNTGLVGGSVAVHDEIVLALSRMNEILSIDEHAGHLVCEAGCVLETLQAQVAAKGFTMPLDLGAKGSCQIGGNVSTNAGSACAGTECDSSTYTQELQSDGPGHSVESGHCKDTETILKIIIFGNFRRPVENARMETPRKS